MNASKNIYKFCYKRFLKTETVFKPGGFLFWLMTRLVRNHEVINAKFEMHQSSAKAYEII